MNAFDRDAISGWGAVIHIIEKDKVRILTPFLKGGLGPKLDKEKLKKPVFFVRSFVASNFHPIRSSRNGTYLFRYRRYLLGIQTYLQYLDPFILDPDMDPHPN